MMGVVNWSPGMPLLPEMTSAITREVGDVNVLPMPRVQVSLSVADSG